jgi:hypothetical protein
LDCLFPDLSANQTKSLSHDVPELLERTRFAEKDDESDSDEEYSSADETEPLDKSHKNSVEEALRYLAKDVDRLHDLHKPLSHPAVDSVAETLSSIAPEIIPTMPHSFFSNRIRERFPETSETVAETLGIVNLWRYQRLLESRSMDHSVQVPDGEIGASSKTSMSIFNDSGYASKDSVLTPSIAQSIISSAVSSLNGKSGSGYPRLTDGAKDGNAFACDACGRQVKYTRNKDYRYLKFHTEEAWLLKLTWIQKTHCAKSPPIHLLHRELSIQNYSVRHSQGLDRPQHPRT